jgi:hypothetical protein
VHSYFIGQIKVLAIFKPQYLKAGIEFENGCKGKEIL